MYKRIIARLDIKGPNLVKGIHLEGLRVLGNPEDYAEFYYLNGADEILIMDVVASLFGRNSLFEFIKKISQNVFIPITVGGGIRTIEDIREMLRSGADKVSINTAALSNPNFIKLAAEKFGSSTIVIAIEAIKHKDGKYYCYTDNGREETNVEVLDWAKKVEELGAGEIIITSVDNEGTGGGFDCNLISMVSSCVGIPVIAHGGFGKSKDSLDVINAGASAIAIASSFHYKFISENRVKRKSETVEGNFEFLESGAISLKVNLHDINEIKEYLLENSIMVRYQK